MAAVPPANKVLVIDDDNDILEFVVELLQDEISVSFANNGPKGIELAKIHKPDLILLDVMMPEMDGFEVCKRLQWIPETKNIPVIFLTGMGDEDDISSGLRLGAVDYITKPFNPDHVIAKVRNQLEKITAIRPSPVSEKKDRRVTDQIVDQPKEPEPAAPQGMGKWRLVFAAAVLTVGIGLGIKWLIEAPSEPPTKRTEIPSPKTKEKKPVSLVSVPAPPAPKTKAQVDISAEQMEVIPTDMLETAWVGKSQCVPLPKVKWWKNHSHIKIVTYVNQKYEGDWSPYINKWVRRMAKVQAIHDRDATVVTSDGRRLQGAVLDDYIDKMAKRISVTRCLALEAAKAASRRP